MESWNIALCCILVIIILLYIVRCRALSVPGTSVYHPGFAGFPLLGRVVLLASFCFCVACCAPLVVSVSLLLASFGRSLWPPAGPVSVSLLFVSLGVLGRLPAGPRSVVLVLVLCRARTPCPVFLITRSRFFIHTLPCTTVYG